MKPFWWVKWAILAISLATFIAVLLTLRFIRQHSAHGAHARAKIAFEEATTAHLRIDRHDIELKNLQDDGTDDRSTVQRLWGRVKFLTHRYIGDELGKEQQGHDDKPDQPR